ncbi:MAG: metallophosphoesterase [Pirellulaceae bacterium]|jgi:predicted phosphodiesterase
MKRHWQRREWLRNAGVSVGIASSGQLLRGSDEKPLAKSQEVEPGIAFFFVSDTHYLARQDQPDQIDSKSAEICGRLVDTLNSLPGSSLPDSLGGGKVAEVRGVIHGGDIIDSGDKRGKNFEAMQETEWRHFDEDFGLTGKEGRLKYPVFEVHGNHDSPDGKGLAIDRLRERVSKREGVHRSDSGLHYSWDWGDLHCIHLGIVVGRPEHQGQRRRYHPFDSLAFLQEDLQRHDPNKDRPLLLTHHIDLPRYSQPCQLDAEKNLQMEWHPCDVQEYHQSLQGRRVAGILYGHTHVRQVMRWDGTPKPATSGHPLLNADNASHFSGPKQGFFYLEWKLGKLLVRECLTDDGWASYRWNDESWELDS